MPTQRQQPPTMNRFCQILVTSMALMSPVATICAATPPTQVADVGWGASPAVTRNTILRRPGVEFVSESPDSMVFKGGAFGGHDVETWRFEFKDGRFFKAIISFVRPPGKNKDGNLLVDLIWGELQKGLKEKYGKAQDLSALGHGELLWSFPDRTRPEKLKSVRIYFGWWGSRLDITYTDHPIGSTAPQVPIDKARRDF